VSALAVVLLANDRGEGHAVDQTGLGPFGPFGPAIAFSIEVGRHDVHREENLLEFLFEVVFYLVVLGVVVFDDALVN
jgi:hypothetical protein